MRIALVIHSLSGGGAERVASILASGFSVSGDDVVVVTSEPPDSDFYTLLPKIGRQWIGPMKTGGAIQKSWNNLLRLSRLRRTLEAWAPDVVISFMGPMNARVVIALLPTATPVVVTEHSDPRHAKLSVMFRAARRLTYPLASSVVSVSKGVDQGFRWLPAYKRRVINNPLPGRLSSLRSEAPVWQPRPGRSTLAAMGRLVTLKGFDLLIDAFSNLAKTCPDWDLLILGDGPERGALERQVSILALDQRVHFPGVVQNPFAVLTRCDLFVLPSRYEGFGNALIEAMACGLPVIAADCQSGPSEIIDHGSTGLLTPVGDVSALSRALGQLMEDERQRSSLAESSLQAVEPYRQEVIVQQWYTLLTDVVEKKRG